MSLWRAPKLQGVVPYPQIEVDELNDLKKNDKKLVGGSREVGWISEELRAGVGVNMIKIHCTISSKI